LSRFDDSSLIKKNEDFERRLRAANKVAREISQLVEDLMERAGSPIRLEPRGYGAVSDKHYATGLKAESIPDFVAKPVDGDRDLARVDAKGKSRVGSVGLINVRDALKYVQTTVNDGLPIFVCALVDPNCARNGDASKIRATLENTFLATLLEQEFDSLVMQRQWDGNWTFDLKVEPIAVFPDRFHEAVGKDHSPRAQQHEKVILARLRSRGIRIRLDSRMS